MSIKKVDAKTLKELVSKVNSEEIKQQDTIQEEISESEISAEELSELYELGLKELDNLKVMLVVSQLDMVSSPFSSVFEISEPIQEYFKYMLFLCEEVLPKLLKGDIDDIIDIAPEEADKTSEVLYDIRENIFKILKSKKNDL